MPPTGIFLHFLSFFQASLYDFKLSNEMYQRNGENLQRLDVNDKLLNSLGDFGVRELLMVNDVVNFSFTRVCYFNLDVSSIVALKYFLFFFCNSQVIFISKLTIFCYFSTIS